MFRTFWFRPRNDWSANADFLCVFVPAQAFAHETDPMPNQCHLLRLRGRVLSLGRCYSALCYCYRWKRVFHGEFRYISKSLRSFSLRRDAPAHQHHSKEGNRNLNGNKWCVTNVCLFVCWFISNDNLQWISSAAHYLDRGPAYSKLWCVSFRFRHLSHDFTTENSVKLNLTQTNLCCL